MAEQGRHHFIPVRFPAQDAEQNTRAGFFHPDGHGEGIQCPQFQQLFQGKTHRLAGHIVNVALQRQNPLRFFFRFSQQNPNTVGSLKVLFAHAVSHGLHTNRGHIGEFGDEMLQQRSPGGGTQLPGNFSAVNGDVPQQLRRSRSRNRQHPMGAPDASAAHMDRRDNHLVRFQLVHQQANRCNIRQGIQGAHFVKVDILHRHAMDMAFRLGNELIHRQHIQLYHGGNGHGCHNIFDIPQTGMAVVMMVLSFFLTAYRYPKMGAGDAALFFLFQRNGHTGQAQAVHGAKKIFFIRQQLAQRRRQHISRRTHAAVNVERFHDFASM